MDTYTFTFNGHEVPNLTMSEAIDLCRRHALEEGKATKLGVINSRGNHLYLGSYSPLPEKLWQPYVDKHGNPVAQLTADPAVDDTDEPVESITAFPCKDGSLRLFINGKPDPRNRVFAASAAMTARADVRSWFRAMKDAGLFPFVSRLEFYAQ